MTAHISTKYFFFYIYDDMNDTFSQQMNDVLNTPFCHFCLELKKHAVTEHSSSYFINNGIRKKLSSDKLSGTKQN